MEVTEKSSSGSHSAGGNVVVELPVGELVSSDFDLEKAVCSHGLFMMAPNQWDSVSKTLERPLRLNGEENYSSPSVTVQISQPSDTPHSLLLRVFGVDCLSNHQKEALLDQVRRMLRLSEEEEQNVREFQGMYNEAKKNGFGRLFRSPTLFEDMVKCILLCNCQWSRTLSMARALCELQLELEFPLSSPPVPEADDCSGLRVTEVNHFLPRTPAKKERKRRNGSQKVYSVSAISNREVEAGMDKHVSSGSNGVETPSTNISSLNKLSDDSQALGESDQVNLYLNSDVKLAATTNMCSSNRIGNFPSPRELVNLDEKILANRCNLGYRAKRILNLARSVVEGRIQLRQLEEACSKPSLSSYNKLADQLREIEGFGPYTCANVLMCMGFYHVVPSDSETIRHIKQVHGRTSNIQTVEEDIEVIYGKYAPFQFLVYWWEVWSFYEEKFGKLSEMLHSDYKLITATNLKPKTPKTSRQRRRIKFL